MEAEEAAVMSTLTDPVLAELWDNLDDAAYDDVVVPVVPPPDRGPS